MDVVGVMAAYLLFQSLRYLRSSPLFADGKIHHAGPSVRTVLDLSLAEIVGSNSARCIDVCCECCQAEVCRSYTSDLPQPAEASVATFADVTAIMEVEDSFKEATGKLQ
jgi:hypothetical protein